MRTCVVMMGMVSAGVLPPATAGAQPAVRAAHDGAVAVPSPSGLTRFMVDRIDAPRSAAARENSDLADKNGRIPAPTPGYTLTDGVVVRCDDARAVAELTVGMGEAGRIAAAPGFWLVRTGSVRRAIALADAMGADPRVAEAYIDIERPASPRSLPTDPGFPIQWHLRNTLIAEADANVEEAWALGYTGAGVTIGILEGGWQTTHPDLAANFNAAASENGGIATDHGTAVAGVAAAVANNGQGGAGSAHGAWLSQLIRGTSARTAEAFGYRNDLNHIKSNSWGPQDNGRAWSMSSVERAAIEQAIATGRGGRGTIFAWAAGNGGGSGDRCDYDPYVSSRYTLAIGAVGDQDVRASYNETGSSMLVVSHSDGNVRDIYTTDVTGPGGYWGGNYYGGFGGTSAACPLAAGVVAMMLEANPDLTWRDVQHILVRSARTVDPTDPQWTLNGAGHEINYNYGFGAVDAGAAVELAETWRNVGAERKATSGVLPVGEAVPEGDLKGLVRTFVMPQNLRVESVEVVLNATTLYAGDLRITLTSPWGTESLLAATRSDATDHYTDYLFTSVRHWDEPSAGVWTMRIADLGAGDAAVWDDWTLNVYGTPIRLREPIGGQGPAAPGSVRRVPPP